MSKLDEVKSVLIKSQGQEIAELRAQLAQNEADKEDAERRLRAIEKHLGLDQT